jgi:hypothetical protein
MPSNIWSKVAIPPRVEVVGLGELGYDNIDLFADLFVAPERGHVGEAAALRHHDQTIRIASVFVGNIFYEKKNKNVILVLGSIHATAKLVATLPKRAIYFGFLDGHLE